MAYSIYIYNKTGTFHPVSKDLNIFRTNDKIVVITCYLYNMRYIFLVLIFLLIFSLSEALKARKIRKQKY